MTDKQIIIDGVDVSRCSYGEIEKSIFKCSCEYNIRSASMFCKDNPNCYYKQLKHKEQECETLASQLDFEVQKKECLEQECERWKSNFNGKVSAIEELLQQLDKLKAENKELKKKLRELELKNTTFQNRYQQLDGATIELNRYRKALEEIENIIQKQGSETILTFPDLPKEGNYKFVMTQCNQGYTDILDIINKADFGKSEHSETRPGESCVEPVEPPIIQEAKGEE